MAAQKTVLDWHVCRENDWEQMVEQVDKPASAPTSASNHRRRLGIRRLWLPALVACLAIVVLVTLAGYLSRQAETGVEMIERDLRQTVELDSWRQPADGQSVVAKISPIAEDASQAASIRPQTAFENFRLYGDLALVQVYLSSADGQESIETFRQTRVYRQGETGWGEVAPNEVDWGKRKIRETERFVFQYTDIDVQAVEAVAAELDAIYTALRSDFALQLPSGKLTIDIAPRGDGWRNGRTIRKLDRLLLESPATQLVPAEIAPAEVLIGQIIPALTQQAFEDALQTNPFDHWRDLLFAYKEWEAQRHNPLLAAWAQDLAQWKIRQGAGDVDKSAWLDALGTLCAQHRIRERVPFLSSFAILYPCFEERAIFRLYQLEPPAKLDQLLGVVYQYGTRRRPPASECSTSLDCMIFLDYAVARQGRPVLAQLAQGFSRYEDWKTLIPAVFHTSAEELEADWQRYLERLGEPASSPAL